MKKSSAGKKNLRIPFGNSWMWVWLALITFLLTELLSKFPAFTGSVYSRGLYPVVAAVLSRISYWLPFSLGDMCYVLLVLLVLAGVILLLIRKINVGKFLKILVNMLAMLYVLFYWLWGFNYYRDRLNQRLQIAVSEPTDEVFLEVARELILETNASRVDPDGLPASQIDSLVEEAYRNLSGFLELNYPGGVRRAKSITFSDFFAKASILGYYGPFFNEIHLNDHLLPVQYPQVLAHEKAHQFGITGEAEANFYAWLVCTRSPSPELNYSANLYLLRFFLYRGMQVEGFEPLTGLIDEPVKEDIRRVTAHWKALRSEKIDRVATWVNDMYLKSNKIEGGVNDYRGVVKLVMDFKADEAAQERLEKEFADLKND
ncbi:DUF3810 domain-containing protein [Gaoshiqia sp. Z1-71]|uniref:DUF3810 domain-containing protein n=1 Tax=Gaoshiqia hydrogeniformans TaxID=3290090 RepID=UPI003BF77D14